MSRQPGTSSSTRRHGIAALAMATGVACTIALAVAPASAATEDPTPDHTVAEGNRPNALPKLKGSVGPGPVISISEESVPAGRYKLVVSDKGTNHNFHITGDGVDKATSVPETGRVVWKVTLSAGTYKIRCDPHRSMRTKLTVT